MFVRALTSLSRQAVAGATGAVVTFALVISLGLLAYASLGPQAAGVGVAAAFAATAVSALLFALCSGTPLPIGGPSSATTIILAALIARVAGMAPAGSTPVNLTLTAVAAASAAVVGMGLLQIVMALLRLGRFSAYVPQTVLSGFMDGVALLVLVAQVPVLLAIDPTAWQADPWGAMRGGHPAAMLLGLGTAAGVWLLAWRAPRLPAVLIGMLAGMAIYHLLRQNWPGLDLGATLGPVTVTMPGGALPPPLARPALGSLLLPHATAIVLTSLLLALMGSLEAMLSLRAIDRSLALHSDGDRVLLANGLANLVGGVFGALPLTVLRTGALAVHGAGGHGRAAACAAAATSALLLAGADDAISLLPRVVVAGVMLTIGVALADRWSRGMLRRLHRDRSVAKMGNSLFVVGLVCALTVTVGVGAGVGAGLLLATAMFMRSQHGTVIRARYDAASRPSRRVWPAPEEQVLRDLRSRIVTFELHGALFFGNAPRIVEEARRLPLDCRFLVLDLRRVNSIDETGATMLSDLGPILERRQVQLLLAAAVPTQTHGRWLSRFGAEGNERHPDADRAIEAAERQLLAEKGVLSAGSAHPAFDTLLRGVEGDDANAVNALMTTRTLVDGEHLFRQGDPSDGLYVVTSGSISVVSASGDHRYASFSPGIMLGELAMLDGGQRSADARADGPTEVRRLTHTALDELTRQRPTVAATIYRNIASHLSHRLRVAGSAWAEAAN
ncbi:MAG TPA: SulP family inorganic anion transporter [Rubrivivax sp.]